MRRLLLIVLAFGSFALSTGFNLDNAIVPKEEIASGGVRKDGIPAILDPQFITPKKALHVGIYDQVIGVDVGGVSKAYPIKILNLHEIVNDEINGIPIAVTY